MNVRHVMHVFRKDGIELLRDRRTLFVNVLLPMLLYPLMGLFMIQVVQLTRAQKKDPPRVALVAVPAGLAERLAQPAEDPDELAEGESTAAAAPAGRTPDAAARRAALPRVDLVPLDAASEATLLRLATDLHRERPPRDGSGPDAAGLATRAEALAELRRLRLTSAVVALSEPGIALMVLKDDADSGIDHARAALNRAVDAWRRQLVETTLAAKGLGRGDLEPIAIESLALAPMAEATRSRLAGFIPILLVLMAISGAFYPALDLFAGERERGTLETLLTLPVARKGIFVGKLLVTCAAAIISVVLNISSLGLTIGIAGSQIAPPGSGPGMASLLSVGAGTLLLSFIVLLPVTVTIAVVSLALAGLAASSKEAQNYLTPLFLVAMVAAGVALVPDARPSLALDLIPITGPVLALKESLRAAQLPWLHLGLSTAASLATAVVVVGWAVRLLESEAFCYPGLVRAGWGRWRTWGRAPAGPPALEAMAVFAVVVGGMTMGAGLFRDLGPVAMVVGPLVGFVLLVPLLHGWLGAYPAATALGLERPARGSFRRAALAIPFAVLTSTCLGLLQAPLFAEVPHDPTVERLIGEIRGIGGLPLLLFCIAIVPGVCEEVLCRGTLLGGLRRSLGDWGGIILSAFLFAILHLSPDRFIPQFVVGLALGALAIRARSIYPGMLLHAGHNGLVVLVAVLVGDQWLEGYEIPVYVLVPVALCSVAGMCICLGGLGRWVGARTPPREMLGEGAGRQAGG